MASSSPFLAVCAALVVTLAGCGESKFFHTDRPLVRITLDEYRIVPQNISVRAGRMRFVVRNTGRLPHDLVIQVPTKTVGVGPIEIARVQTMQPGEVGNTIDLVLRPGTYRLVCTIANHGDLGQFGALEVR